MNVAGIDDAMVETSYAILKKEAGEGGYNLNPDTEFVKNLVRGLLRNEQRYGYRACPCRLASGKRGDDLDIICPCDYRDSDIEEHGACYCALYVNAGIAAGKQPVAPVPERRPPRSERGRKNVVLTVPSAPSPFSSLPLPVWRCKVCGYLCARDQPPGICPICKAGKDRFERFI